MGLNRDEGTEFLGAQEPGFEDAVRWWCVRFKPCSRACANYVTALKRIPRAVFSHLRTLRHQDGGHTEVQPCRITQSCSVLSFRPLPGLQGLVSLMLILLLPSGSPCPEGRVPWKGGSSLLCRRIQVWDEQCGAGVQGRGTCAPSRAWALSWHTWNSVTNLKSSASVTCHNSWFPFLAT